MYYLGNAVTTIKSNDKVKVFTVRGTSFEPATADGGDASQENGMSYCPALHRDQKLYSHTNTAKNTTDMLQGVEKLQQNLSISSTCQLVETTCSKPVGLQVLTINLQRVC